MRLVLHIGTHKTGTTAIQRFLAGNRPALAEHGFHVASHGSSPDANLVANAVGAGDTDAVRGFFEQQVATARRAGAEAVVVSAENFYGMSVVAAALAGRLPDDAEAREPVLVRRLQSLLPASLSDVRVACCFRRPDRLAESLYNQRIKYETYDASFDRYLQAVGPLFAYHRNASAWADTFGRSSCTFTTYESVQGDIRQAFVRDVLGIADTELFVEDGARDNERVSRDVLEFKREVNRTTPDRERELAYRVACLLEQQVGLLAGEPKQYQEFFSPTERTAFLDSVAGEVAALQAEFALPPFPPAAAAATWQPYPGLSAERREQLQREYARIKNREMAGRHRTQARRAVRRIVGRVRRP